jgi:adenylate kinase family enzyme
MIVFILGRTGSGKSTTARFLGEVAQHQGWSVQFFNDYIFLREMYLADTMRRFRATEHDGFEVLDLSVYETAIQLLVQQVQSSYSGDSHTLLIVEFTSNNYRNALQFFDEILLSNAHFLFLNADLKTCLERISKRIFNQLTADDYYVIDKVLLNHYPCPYMPFRIGERKAKYIQNMGSLNDLRNKILILAPTLLEEGVPVFELQTKLIYKPDKSSLNMAWSIGNAPKFEE